MCSSTSATSGQIWAFRALVFFAPLFTGDRHLSRLRGTPTGRAGHSRPRARRSGSRGARPDADRRCSRRWPRRTASAIAASETVERVAGRIDDADLLRRLDELRLDAREVRGRCLEAERELGEEQELLAHAKNTVSEHAADLAGASFKAGTGPLQAWSFLVMGEAGELATWTALCSARGRRDGRLVELAEWGQEGAAAPPGARARGRCPC